MHQANIEATLSISGKPDFDPQIVTERLMVEPTSIWRCKPQVAAKHAELNVVSWQYEMKELHCIEFSDALGLIVEKFWTHQESIRFLAAQHQLNVAFILIPEGELRNFVTVIEAPLIQKVAQLKGKICLNFDKLD